MHCVRVYCVKQIVLLILKCFNNSTFFNTVCVSWLFKVSHPLSQCACCCWLHNKHHMLSLVILQTFYYFFSHKLN